MKPSGCKVSRGRGKGNKNVGVITRSKKALPPEEKRTGEGDPGTKRSRLDGIRMHATTPPEGETVSTTYNKNDIQLFQHCLFCIRKTITDSSTGTTVSGDSNLVEDMLQEVPSAGELPSTDASLLCTLNRTWGYLLQGGNWNWDRDLNSMPDQFHCLPKMCRFCAEKLGAIDRMMGELIAEINKLGTLVRESRIGGLHSWRVERFEQLLTNTVPDGDTRRKILTFLGNSSINTASTAPKKRTALSSESRRGKLRDRENSENTTPAETTINLNIVIKGEETSSSECDDDGDEGQGDFECDNNDTVASTPDADNLNLCGKSEDSTYEYKFDLETNEKIYKCIINKCGKTRSSTRAMRRHHREVHNYHYRKTATVKDTSFLCISCDTKLPDKITFQSHKKSCNGRRMRACDLCRTRIPKEEIYEHVRGHVGEYLVKCPNPECQSGAFCTTKGLSNHLIASKICQKSIPDSQAGKFQGNKHVCEVCDREFDKTTFLRRHILLSHENDEKPFSCPLQHCQKRFSERQSVILHLNLHLEQRHAPGFADNTQKCDVCQESMSVETMEGHLKDVHSMENVIKCSHCPFLFTSREHLVDHLFVHRYSGLACDICEGESSPKFTKHHDLRKHYYEAHQIGTKLPCDQCSWEFLSPCYLQQHKLKFHGLTRKRKGTGSETSTNPEGGEETVGNVFLCKECDVVFRTQEALTDHRIAVHGREPWSCDICPAKFPTHLERRRHQKEHDKLVRTFPCQQPGCGRVFTRNVNLTQHIASVHAGESPFMCEHCGKSFPTNSLTAAHIRRVHGSLGSATHGKFRCDVPGCEKVYKARHGLAHHTASVHTGEKPHVCEHCGKAFVHKGTLAVHMKYQHTDGPSYVCDVCGVGFKRPKYLECHKLIHTGERPFECQLCGQKFRQQAVLSRHLEGHDKKGTAFKPTGARKKIRKRVERKQDN